MGRVEVLSSSCDLLSLRRRVGMIFQKPSPFPFSIYKNIDLPLKEHGVKSKSAREERLVSSLKSVGLWKEVENRLHSSALNLSGGQQQRLCIARTIALEPEVILMDEPCSALDPIASGVVEDLICSLRGSYTVVVVTHNLSQAKRISDDVAFFWLKDGTGALIEHGPCEAIFSRPDHELTAAYVNGARG
jgi:phosphate transport system ATP-binding protein